MNRSSRARSLRWRLALVALALCLPTIASAHGRLKSSSPAAGAHLARAPRELRLDFSEAPDLTFSSLRLTGPDGADVALGPLGYPADSHRSLVATIAAALMPGRYVVAWQAAGDDGHPVRGQFEFVIAPGATGVAVGPAARAGAGSGSVLPRDPAMGGMHHDPDSMPEGNGFGADSMAYVIIRWVQFVALLLVIGAVAFHRLVLGALRRRAVSHAGDGRAELLPLVEARTAIVGVLAVGMLTATLVARLAAQSYAMHGGDHPFDLGLMGPMIGRTMWGWGWLVELGGLALAGVALWRAAAAAGRRRTDPCARSSAPRWWTAAAAGAILMAFAPSLSSHASAAPRLRALAMLADGSHILAASTWLGTLAVLLLAGIPVAMADGGTRGTAFVRDAVTAFSPVALVSAGIAASTGAFAAWLHVGTIPNLWGTRYGLTLLVKLGVLGAVALTGFYNWRFVQPRLGSLDATARLRRSAIVEVGVAVVVLLVTAVLVASPTSMDATM